MERRETESGRAVSWECEISYRAAVGPLRMVVEHDTTKTSCRVYDTRNGYRKVYDGRSPSIGAAILEAEKAALSLLAQEEEADNVPSPIDGVLAKDPVCDVRAA